MKTLALPLGCLHLLVLAAALQAGWGHRGDWLIQCVILLTLSYGLSFWIRSRAPAASALYPMVFQIFCLTVTHYLFGTASLLTVLLIAVVVVELAGWFSWRWPALLATEAVLAAVLLIRPFEAPDQSVEPLRLTDVVLVAVLAAALTWGTLRLLRLEARGRRQAAEIDVLNRSVGLLLNANLDFQDYAVKVGESSVIQERQRLSREIHDVVGYTLTNVRMMLEHAGELAVRGDSRLGPLLAEARDEVQNGLSETRTVLRQFREIENGAIEGIHYIQKLVKTFSHATGITVKVNYGNLPWMVPAPFSAVLYRIVQESMTNAFRHGRATQVKIRFWIALGLLHVLVEDNGAGGTAAVPGIGLTGMTERLTPLGGKLSTESHSRGFTLRVEIPFSEEGLTAEEIHGTPIAPADR
jgi:signal transduction histidine kinase